MAHRLRPTKCIFHLDSFSPSLCVWSDWKGKQSKHPYYALNIAGALLKAREHELQSKTQRVTPSRGSPWASRKRNWELLYTVIGQLKMDELIGKIHVVNKRNQELIASVDALEDVVLHKYWIQYDVKGFFKLQELVEKKKGTTSFLIHSMFIANVFLLSDSERSFRCPWRVQACSQVQDGYLGCLQRQA